MHKIVDINEAIIAYLDGKKVRRHITMEEFVNNQKMRVKKTNKRVANRHTWWNNWVWNDGTGKKTALSFDDSEILSPIEAFEKSGFDKNKLWSIKL